MRAPARRAPAGAVPRLARMWRAPRAVLAEVLAGPAQEPRAFATLVAAALLIFVAQWPLHARAAHLDPAIPLEARLAGALMGSVFLLLPLAYLVAALSHLAARLAGGQGTGWGARMALFWALLSVAPLMLLRGLLAGFGVSAAGIGLVDLAAGVAFLLFWGLGLREAEFGPAARGDAHD